MAADRTLMAWVRTALSMISFGFTIYKVLQSFHAEGHAAAADYNARNAGLLLIGLGTISAAMGTIEYWQTLKELSRQQKIRIWRPSFAMAMVISVGGLIVFMSVLARVL